MTRDLSAMQRQLIAKGELIRCLGSAVTHVTLNEIDFQCCRSSQIGFATTGYSAFYAVLDFADAELTRMTQLLPEMPAHSPCWVTDHQKKQHMGTGPLFFILLVF